MLSGDLSEMSEVDVHMPDYLQLKVLLSVVDGRSTYHTVELLHEISPVLPFEHCESTILKVLSVRRFNILHQSSKLRL